MVVDGECVYVGGYNVGNEYMGEKLLFVLWCDMYIEIVGVVVMDL